jgi:hypothetical protein
LKRIGAERIVETPVMADSGNLPLLVKQHFRSDIGPDMRMRNRSRRRADSEQGEQGEQQIAKRRDPVRPNSESPFPV